MRNSKAYLRHERAQQSCLVEEISPGAACVRAELPQGLQEGAEVVLEIPGFGRVPAEVILLPNGAIGLMFLNDLKSQVAMRHWLAEQAGNDGDSPRPH